MLSSNTIPVVSKHRVMPSDTYEYDSQEQVSLRDGTANASSGGFIRLHTPDRRHSRTGSLEKSTLSTVYREALVLKASFKLLNTHRQKATTHLHFPFFRLVKLSLELERDSRQRFCCYCRCSHPRRSTRAQTSAHGMGKNAQNIGRYRRVTCYKLILECSSKY